MMVSEMNCDRIAGAYRWMEYAAFGNKLQQRRREFVDLAASARRVLLVGEGDGRFGEAARRHGCVAHIDCVDASAEMLRRAKSRICAAGQGTAEFHDMALPAKLPGKDYDLVVTNFFLDCFSTEELQDVVARIASAATRNATWVVSEFRLPERGWRRARALAWLKTMYWFFGLATGLQTRRLPDHRRWLEREGFHLREERVVSAGFIASELWVRG